MIVFASEANQVRLELIEALHRLQEQSAEPLRILDVGGGKNSWLGDLVTDIIDLGPSESQRPGVRVWRGDVQDDSVWESFSDNEFDFVSCTHTLEDIRDPARVLAQISRVGKRGLVTTPNRFQELSHVESVSWLGNYHHRWIFSIVSGTLQCVAKWHYINPVSQSSVASRLLRLLSPILPKRILAAAQQTFPRISRNWKSVNSLYTWSRPDFDELSVVWVGKLELRYFNNDLCGLNPKDSAELVSSFLSDPTVVEAVGARRRLFELMDLGQTK